MSLVLNGSGTITGATTLASTVTSPTLTTPVVTSTLGVGGATPSASGAGITFPATQSASSDANTLDDYEEGTFTPAFKATGSTFNYSYQAGAYTKVGRLVTCMIAIGLNGTGNTFNGSILTVTGLPFTQLAGSLYWNVTPVNFASLATSVVSLQGRLSLGTEIELNKLTAASTNPAVMVASDLNPTSGACIIYILATYSVA